jgi:hypothetical protein
LLLIIAQALDVGDKHNPVQGCREIVPESGNHGREIFASHNLAFAFVTDAKLATDLHQSDMFCQSSHVTIIPMQVVIILIREYPRWIAGNHSLQLTTSLRARGAAVEQIRQTLHGEGSLGTFAL